MRRFAAGFLVSICGTVAQGHAGDQPDKPTLQSVSKAVQVIAKATKSATLEVNSQTKSLEGSFFGTDMSLCANVPETAFTPGFSVEG